MRSWGFTAVRLRERVWPQLLLVTISTCLPALSASANDGKIAFWSTRNGNNELYTMNPDGTDIINVTNTPDASESLPNWNAEGNKIIYQRGRTIWMMNGDGTDQKLVTTDQDPSYGAFWPNTNLVSYTRYGLSDYDIFMATKEGAYPSLLLRQFGHDSYGRWNADGSQLAYQHTYYDSRNYVSRVNADGSGQFTMTSSGTDRSPNWHPDGTRLVYQSSRHGNEEIYIINADGTGETRITNNSANDTTPVFSPDGNRIAFVSDRDGNREIYVMNADGNNQTRITNSVYIEDQPSWGANLPGNGPKVSVSQPAVTESTAGAVNADFIVSLSTPATEPVTVTYHTEDGTAKAGLDYTAQELTTITFAPGETSKTISVPVLNDEIDEPVQNFFLRVSTFGATLAKQRVPATITDDDRPPSLVIKPVTLKEGDEGTTNAVFTVTTTKVSDYNINAVYATSDGTATAGTDYTARSGQIYLPAGQLSVSITIPIFTDRAREPDETFTITLSRPKNATLRTATALGTILNDDPYPYLLVSDASAVEGNTISFDLQLSYLALGDVTIQYSTVDASATTPGDYIATTGTIVIPQGETSTTVTVDTRADSDSEPNESFQFNITEVTNALTPDPQAIGTITNDDFPDIFVSDVQEMEGHDGIRQMVFSIALSEPAPTTMTVSYISEDFTAREGIDYYPAIGGATFQVGESSKAVAALIIGDSTLESNEIFLLKLTGTTHGIIVTPQARGTIVNDDAQSTISIADVTVAEGNTGASDLTFTIRLSNPTTKTVTVDYTTADGTALAGSDYTAWSGRVSIPAGQTTVTINVPVLGDAIPEEDETFLLTLSNPINATISDSEATGTITNDDTVAELKNTGK